MDTAQMKTTPRSMRIRKENVARLVYDFLTQRKVTQENEGSYYTATIHQELEIDRSRFYDAMQYLSNKGYVKNLGRRKEDDGLFVQRFKIEKEFPVTIPPIDLETIRKANAGKEETVEKSTPVTTCESTLGRIEDFTKAEQVTMVEMNDISADDTLALINYMEKLEKAVDTMLDELVIAKNCIIADRRNRDVLKEKIYNLTQRVNELRFK